MIEMDIQLDKDFRIKSDKRNLILERRTEVEDKKTFEVRDRWSTDGFYTSLSALLHGYIRKSVLNSSANDLRELSKDINNIEDKIDNFIKGISKEMI